MKTRLIRTIIVVLFCTVSFCTMVLPLSAQEPRPQQNHSSESNEQNVLASAQGKVLKTDLQRMQILLEQMQRNVAFVSPGDTPLKHQFQLEIEMWQLLIHDMQRNASTQQAQ